MRRSIMISHSKSGINIYLCKEALGILGGLGNYVKFVVNVSEQDELYVKLEKYKGISKRGNPSISLLSEATSQFWAARMQIPKLKLKRLGLECPKFGKTKLGWNSFNENGEVSKEYATHIEFVVPPTDQLDPPPNRVTKKTNKKSPEMDLVAEDKWGKLSRIIREMNELLCSDEYKDVSFYLQTKTDLVHILHGCKIKAEQTIIRSFE